MSIRDLLDSRNSFEGLCGIARELGYRDPCCQLMNRDGSCVGDLIYFLEDNPGAMETLMDWIRENHKCPDCEERIDGCICDDEAEEDSNSDTEVPE